MPGTLCLDYRARQICAAELGEGDLIRRLRVVLWAFL